MVVKEIYHMDLDQIAESGQCFRWKKLNENTYRIPAFGKCVDVFHEKNIFTFSCSEEEFNNIWYEYFDLGTEYDAIDRKITDDKFLNAATQYGNGIRILKQDLWEMIISFIISQNNNIPRIKSSIEKLCDTYSDGIRFPEVWKILDEEEKLKDLGLGYRDKYIIDACSYWIWEVTPTLLNKCGYKRAKEQLLSIYGIGEKVANCICLFGCHYLEACPIDTWMKKIINEEYDGVTPEWMSSKYAGYYQQLAFYYKRSKSNK